MALGNIDDPNILISSAVDYEHHAIPANSFRIIVHNVYRLVGHFFQIAVIKSGHSPCLRIEVHLNVEVRKLLDYGLPTRIGIVVMPCIVIRRNVA